MLLLEAGFLAAFLGSRDQPPPTAVIVLFWWLVFRLEFGAGMIKMRGGREWRDLTALMYHHQTQPMPGPLSRQAHLLPGWFHRAEALGSHIIIATQLWLVLTGNFAWLNWATVVLACSAISVTGSGAVAATDPGALAWFGGLPPYWFGITTAVGLLVVALSWPALRNLFASRQLMNASFNRWQLANAYGAFGTVTKERVEYVIEGTVDEDPGAAEWLEYGFKGKPGDVRRVPRQFAPYHLRLDWLMWFLPLGRSLDEWFTALLVRLLEADAPTLALLADDPFRGERPRWVRVTSYRYRFASHAERRADGAVWVRDRRRPLVQPVGLERPEG
jgi:hypothetical protein